MVKVIELATASFVTNGSRPFCVSCSMGRIAGCITSA